MRFVTGFRGSRKLKVGDYSFTKNKVSGHKMYWSCARAALHKCKARVVTTDVDGNYITIIIISIVLLKCQFVLYRRAAFDSEKRET